jgi:DNA-directed RNA polymerase subunit M/transcription elongation factor TFIIS
MQPLEARRSQAGNSMRCPWCLSPQTVPQESRDDREPEQYPLRAADSDATAGPQPAAENYIPVVCDLCHTRMYATPEQVSKRLTCPDCGKVTIVRPPALPHKPSPETPEDGPAPDIYNVLEGTEQPPPTSQAVYGKYIPVFCGACRTRMLATEDQVGRELVCPDCGTKTRVVPPAETVELDRPDVSQAGQYDLAGVDQPGPDSAALREQFRFACPVCSTHLHAMPEEAGHETRCPDCFTTFTIPKPPRKPQPSRPKEDAVEPYRAWGKPVETPPVEISGFEPVRGNEPLRRLTEEEMEVRGERFVPERKLAPLPRWPLVRGVFDFPFRSTTWPRWVMLMAFGSVVGFISGIGFLVNLRLAQVLFLMIFLGGVAAALSGVWLVMMAKACLTIVVDTAGGIDDIDSWNQENFLDRFFDLLYPFSSFGWGALLGLILDSGLRACGLPEGAGLLLCLFLIPPIALLSMLETGTWLHPFSMPLWGSLFWGWRGWATFYLMAALLDAAFALVWMGLDYAVGWYALFLLPALLVTWCMIYFRLLGRMGLYCADHIARERRREK